jgi:hypothetical protein
MFRDRSEQSEHYCSKFIPWIPHLGSFERHWEKRKMYLLERDRRAYQMPTAETDESKEQ